jgi:hypothetical protein
LDSAFPVPSLFGEVDGVILGIDFVLAIIPTLSKEAFRGKNQHVEEG